MNLKASLIQLPRRSDSCHQCQDRFERGNDYYSLLCSDELNSSKKEALCRKDFCLLCWQKDSQEVSRNQTGSYWKSTIPKKSVVPEVPLKREELALSLLKSAVGTSKLDTDLSDVEIFFLALFLARRRILIFRNEIDQSGEKFQVFEVAETEELLALKKVDLRAVDLLSLQKILALKLSPGDNF